MKKEETKEKKKKRIREAIAVIAWGIICCSLIKPIEVKAYNNACSIPAPSTMIELCGDIPGTSGGDSWQGWINWYADLGYTYTGSYQQCRVAYANGWYTGWWLSLKDASGNTYWAILREVNGSYYGFYHHWVCVTESTGNVFYYTNGESIIYRNTWIHVRTHNDYYSASAAHGYFALNDSGRMCTGWHKDKDGKWYYFRIDDTNHEDGACTKVGESTNGGLLWSTVRSATSATPWGQVTSEGLYCFDGVNVVTNVYRKNTSGNYDKVGTKTDRIYAGDNSNQIKPFTKKTLSANTTYVNEQVYNTNGLKVDTSVNGSYTGSQDVYLKNDDYQQIKVNEFNYYIDRKRFTLTQNINSDTAISASTNLYFEETKTIDNPTKTGYTFGGWSASGTGSSLSGTTFKMGTSNATLTAKWTANNYTLTVNPNGGTYAGKIDASTKTMTYDSSNNNGIGIASKTGYIFQGWYTSASGGEAIWDVNGYAIQYQRHTTYWKAGSDWNGSWMGGSLRDWNNMKWNYTDNLTTYAHWNPITYTIVYNKNKPLGASSNVAGTTASSVHSYDAVKNITQNGYTLIGWKFTGWNTSSDGTGTAYYNMQSVKNLTTANGATITLYAQWTPITYKVRFNGNGNWNTSQGSYTQQFTYDVSGTLTANKFTRPDNTTYNSLNYIKGYEFIGWGTSATQKTATYTDKQTVKNLKTTEGAVLDLYAIWKKPITLTIDFNGGKFNDSTANQVLNYTMYNSELSHTFDIKQYYGGFKNNRISANKGINNKLTKTDTNGIQYRFLGYSLNKNATVPDTQFDVYSSSRTESYNIRDNTILYAVWEPVLQMTVQLSVPKNSEIMRLASDIPVTTTLGNFKIPSGTKSTDIPSSATASVNSATIGTNVTNKDLVTYTVSAKGASNIKFSTAADSRILDIYTHGNNNTWFDKLNTTDKFEYTIDNFSNTTSSFTIPQYIGTTKSYKTSNPESATGTSVYAIKFTCTQPSYYYSKYWNSPETTSVYGILFLNPTLPDDNTNGGIILPPSAVEDGAYEFETILN